jgi:hypothetical protein
MHFKNTFILLFTLLAIACNKDKFSTKPQLKLKSISPNPVPNGSIIQFNIEFTDKEGDIGDSIFIERETRVCPGQVATNLSTKIPAFTSTSYQDGIFEIKYIYNSIVPGLEGLSGCPTKTDSSIFKFSLIDKAGNKSDTLITPVVVFLK